MCGCLGKRGWRPSRKEIDKAGKVIISTSTDVLLFANNIQQFYPNCRIRFVRYDGIYAKTGIEMNIIKDYNIELPLLKIIDKAKDFIGSQLRPQECQ